MGNFLVTGISLFIPVTLHTSIIPALMRPDRLGGSPWSPPTMMFYLLLYYGMMYFILWLLSVLGNIYYTTFNCNKMQPWKTLLYANFTPIIGFAGIFLNNTLLLPFVKSMILSAVGSIPYGLHLVNGLLLAPFVFIGTAFSQRFLSKQVCGKF